ncbi:alanine aminotransferase 2-like [Folsomia candida]|uniref:alanine aminotransferase 2-like n=1 Tax=Folsomia candida TaxID=158441 RepID=UPI000B909C41|nr:alanine aminotransferase 2-like [Folsomia candida]
MQVTSSVGYPPLMKLLPSDAVERATAILNEKKREEIVLDGFKLVREHVTNFISQRDNVTTHMDDILLTDAVSAGLSVFQLTLVSSEPFISVRKVVAEMHHPFNKVELISFNSISKGKGDFKAGLRFTNEPTLRGGYMEIYNIDPAIRAVLVQLLSVKQCPNLMGQVGLYAMVNPPIVVEPSYTLFEREKLAIFSNRKIVADKIVKFLNSIPGFYQPKLEAGFVVFPKITIPEKAVTLAVNAGTFPDVFYSLELLEATGIYVEVGSGYGLPSNQSHIK